jgi:amino acid adenylation domain-containing protein
LFLPQSPELYVAWLAILKAGAAVCPLSIDTPRERLNFILNDISANIVISRSDLAAGFKGLDRDLCVITPADDGGAPEASPEGLLNGLPGAPRESEEQPLAYVMYTSGSTGLPKGVAISHRAATQALLAHDKHIPRFQRFLQFASPTFDVSVFESFFPWFRGATLVGCERSLMLNDLPGVINELKVDAAELTPTVAGELLRTRATVPELKVLLTIGEMLTSHVVAEFGFSSIDDGILHGMYGPTEASIHCTVAPEFPAGSSVGNIGVPLDSVSALVISLDESRGDEPDILPCGHVGELVIGGPQLAKFYLNRPQENERAFLHSKSYGRLYRTGDKARLHPNGELECLGRISGGQIKLRGQRIELGEIESVIAKIPGVRNVIVVAVEGILVAFASTDGNTVTKEDLLLECRRWLPKSMVPGDIVCMDELPRLLSGKVDRKALELDYHAPRGGAEGETKSCESDIESAVAKCAEDILGTSVYRSTSLSAIGLDSLKAIKLVASIRTVGISADVVSILEADTVCEIVASILRQEGVDRPTPGKDGRGSVEQSLQDAALASLSALGCTSLPQAVVQSSPIQTAMVAESLRGLRSYSNWIELEFGYGIEVTDLKAAFSKIAQQNDILRSGFVQLDAPTHSHARTIWPELSESCFIETAIFDYDKTFGSPEDILRPFRIQFSRGPGNRVRALVHIHHALYDGWSWEQIMRDLRDALTGKLPANRPPYQLCCDYCTTYSTTMEGERAARYWREQLQDFTPNPWPNFQDRCDIAQKLRISRRSLAISTRDLDVAASTLSVSPQTFFQGAFGYLLSVYLGTPDIIFGTVSSGRTAPIAGIEAIIGPCITSLPLRINLANLRNVQDLLNAVHNLNREFIKHGFLPLRDIQNTSRANADIPLFDSLFVWQDTANDDPVPEALVKEIDSFDFLDFTMTVEFEIQRENIHAKATFQQSKLPVEQVDMFLWQIEELAALFIRAPGLTLKDVNSNLPPSVLSVENPNYDAPDNLPGLANSVQRLAECDPDRVAIEFLVSFDPETGPPDIRELTYAELEVRSNNLATQLAACGLTPGDLAAIVLEKSPELYIAILSVIKVGAGYVPITPQTPIGRMSSIIGEAGCGICLTNSVLSTGVRTIQGLRIIDMDKFCLGGDHYLTPTRNSEYDDSSRHDNQDKVEGHLSISNCLEESKHGFKDTSIRELAQERLSPVAYAIFTSGSTGVPKGVLISHHNLQSNLAVLAEIYPTRQGTKLLQACSHAFDGEQVAPHMHTRLGLPLT